MNVKKVFSYLTLFSLMFFNSFAVQVVTQETTNPDVASKSASAIFLTFIILFFLGFSLILLFIAILVKIYKSLSDYKRKKQDFLFDLFEQDNSQCHINRNTFMKKRNWKRVWLFWKRSPVYINTKEGLTIIGGYNGECIKKENFYMVSLHNKLGMFKQIEQIIMIPNSLRFIVKKVVIEKTEVLILDCEGVDQVGNTDYYYQPLIKSKQNEKEYIDFADMIHKEYFEKTIYRDIIKVNLQQYREGIITSVETNPYTQFNRRKD